MANTKVVLELINISKSYPGVKALNSVNLKLKVGQVHALMGENGAGKSTLMKVIAGIVQPDEGKILLKGKEVRFPSSRDSINHGIAMIHQELSPLAEMTIAENIFLGREPLKGRIIDFKTMNNQTKIILKDMKLALNPKTKMGELTVAQTQMVEIAKAISYNSDIIIMDEPTSAITDREVNVLFGMIEELKKKGKSIVYISHKMDEIFRIADQITVFRDGNYIGTSEASKLEYNELIKMMVARELNNIFPKKKNQTKDVILEVKNLSSLSAFQNINFKLRAGEILGVAGLMGAGRSEVMEAIFGIRRIDSGEIFIKGKKVNIKKPIDAINNGIVLIPEDRKLQSLVLERNILENMTLPSLKNFVRNKLALNKKKEVNEVNKYIETLRVKTPSYSQVIENLSGGNQQKVVLAKWLMLNPEIVIFDEPTRGVDIGAKTEIYQLIADLAEKGVAVILISSELPEILGLSDRVIVFKEGILSGEVDGETTNSEKIMKLATRELGEKKEVEHLEQ
ncbi:sugar ABC transporter ATP-binding protein [Bacillus sp. FJAT-50079]|uniref:sugar ABC transporter ATP-binding protein n=1 Tax=Bacillus sp. FJAT-50079 TaxID=2833577 RepID=UPI001BC9144A|nr:sugar ABC transporter ATP-binding protein [Bacillus sp. FJAT-50079]MBS4208130.1 sugar ABC transporter ATP-binding protein [Bacillus sp. FJAT-50079]